MTRVRSHVAVFLTNSASALELGQALIYQHLGSVVNRQILVFKDDESLYRLLEDDISTALNVGFASHCEPRPGTICLYKR